MHCVFRTFGKNVKNKDVFVGAYMGEAMVSTKHSFVSPNGYTRM